MLKCIWPKLDTGADLIRLIALCLFVTTGIKKSCPPGPAQRVFPGLWTESVRGVLLIWVSAWFHVVWRDRLHLIDWADIYEPQSEPLNLTSFGIMIKTTTTKKKPHI